MATQKKIVVIGSIAYDHVMQYAGRFQDALVAGNYNIALSTHDRKVFFGGCGGNIAYSLRLFGEDPAVITVAGKDFDSYKAWLTKCGINTSHIYQTDKFMTASAFIVSDEEGNQITLFDPGAMHGIDTNQTIREIGPELVSYAIIAPDKPEAMVKFAKECKELGIPYIFDPGQQLSIFEPEDLLRCIQNAFILIANEYEAGLLAQKLRIKPEELSSMPQIALETHGARGCHVKEQKLEHYVRAVQPRQGAVDPTGCGDAFRSGVLVGLQQGFPIQKCCQMGALLATYSLECLGTQCHTFTRAEFARRFENSFGEPLF